MASHFIFSFILRLLFLLTDSNQEYAIRGVGEEGGVFDLLISLIDNGNMVNTLVYNDVHVTLNSKINFTISENSDDKIIQYDFENAGQFENIEADSMLEGDAGYDLAPPETTAVLAGKKHRDGTFIGNALVDFNAGDNLSGILKTWYSLDGRTF